MKSKKASNSASQDITQMPMQHTVGLQQGRNKEILSSYMIVDGGLVGENSSDKENINEVNGEIQLSHSKRQRKKNEVISVRGERMGNVIIESVKSGQNYIESVEAGSGDQTSRAL